MRVVALISGGKDSCYNMMTCVAEGHQIVALANLRPHNADELDSYMYQTVGHHAIDLYAEAMDLPLYVRIIKGASLSLGKDYVPHEGDEVEDLYELLAQIMAERDIDAVSVGAILSDYQRVRVENVCQRLGLKVLAYLWRRNQEELLREMIACDLKAIIIKVAAMGLLPNKHLGMELKDILPHMILMREKYGLNECGEGGEYETFVFDCPLFKKSIVIDKKELVIHSDDAFAPVGYLNLRSSHLEDKPGHDVASYFENIDQVPLLTTSKWLSKHIHSVDVDEESRVEKKPEKAIDQLFQTESHPVFTSDGCRFQACGVTAVTDETSTDVGHASQIAMDTLKRGIENLGHQMSDLLSVNLYVGDMANYVAINTVYKKYFTLNPPTRICLQLSLPSGVLFQLDCQGCVKGQEERRTLYVQSLSLWAPANLGPFSQSILEGDELFVSGTTAIVPSTMKLIDSGVDVQSKVALLHVVEKVVCLLPSCTLSHCPLINGYVTNREHIPLARRVLNAMLKETAFDDDSLSPAVQFCVVPRLPQGALIEWHTCAWRFSDPDQVKLVQYTDDYVDGYTVSIDCRWLKDKPTLSCRMEICRSSACDVSVQEMAAILLRKYCAATKDISFEKYLVKIFYPVGKYSVHQLIDSFSQDVPGMKKEKLPPFSFVPVTALETSQQLVWCQ